MSKASSDQIAKDRVVLATFETFDGADVWALHPISEFRSKSSSSIISTFLCLPYRK